MPQCRTLEISRDKCNLHVLNKLSGHCPFNVQNGITNRLWNGKEKRSPEFGWASTKGHIAADDGRWSCCPKGWPPGRSSCPITGSRDCCASSLTYTICSRAGNDRCESGHDGEEDGGTHIEGSVCLEIWSGWRESGFWSDMLTDGVLVNVCGEVFGQRDSKKKEEEKRGCRRSGLIYSYWPRLAMSQVQEHATSSTNG